MKTVLSLVVALGFVATVGSAQAATVDYTDHLGKVSDTTVAIDLTTLNFAGGKGDADVTGRLPADTEITFTYSFAPSADNSLHSTSLDTSSKLTAFSGYDYTVGHGKHSTEYSGGAFANSFGDEGSHGKYEYKGHDHRMDSLVTVLANINPATDLGSTTIINNSASIADFTSIIDVYKRLYGTVSISYSVSAVPLPGSLVLFASALAGLFVLGRRKNSLRD